MHAGRSNLEIAFQIERGAHIRPDVQLFRKDRETSRQGLWGSLSPRRTPKWSAVPITVRGHRHPRKSYRSAGERAKLYRGRLMRWDKLRRRGH